MTTATMATVRNQSTSLQVGYIRKEAYSVICDFTHTDKVIERISVKQTTVTFPLNALFNTKEIEIKKRLILFPVP